MRPLTLVVIAIVMMAVGAAAAVRVLPRDPVVVVHWSNSHLMRPGLMTDMAARFNNENHRTASGRPIKVQVLNHGSAEQSDDLTSRINSRVRIRMAYPDPVIVTPSSADWLVRTNHDVGRTVVDIASSRSIVKALIGIVTYQDMAEALGWPNKQIGYEDIIALRDGPLGWASYPAAKSEWGRRPLLAFTDPITSTTGRSVLFSLHAIAAGKTTEQLSLADVSDPEVVAYVKNFQTLIDHYMIGTIPLNTKIYQGPRYGHFFLMPEDNLIHLYEGTEEAYINGVEVTAPPIEQPMVMIYPKEGSMVRNNIAGIVDAPWVTPEQVEGANEWIDFLLRPAQQRKFMSAGFRPGSDLSLEDPSSQINSKFGLNPDPGTEILSPERTDPAVAAAIEQSWQDVKRPAVVTFVVDASASMSGNKIEQAKKGMISCLDGMARNDYVGFVSASGDAEDVVTVGPIAPNKFAISDAVERTTVGSSTALYDAIKTGIEMSDGAAVEGDAIRTVVVLSDGRTNRGETQLDDLVKMVSRDEVPIAQFGGLEGEVTGLDALGHEVAKEDIVGRGMAMSTNHSVQVFFIGIGEDADMQIGRILAEATGAEFQGVTEKDLASVLEQFSKYF